MNNELALYKEMLDKAKDTILLLNKVGDILYVNNEAVKLYGYSRKELLHMNITNLRTEDKLELLKRQLAAATKEAIEFETVHVKKDESEFPVGIKAVSIQVDNEKYVLSIIRDITDRVTKEQQLKENNEELTAFNEELTALNEELMANEEELRTNYIQLEEITRKAEKANLAKTQFLANMSHELRTPMNGIIGITELMGYTNLNSEQAEYLNILKSSSNHLLSIINDLLGVAKIETGKTELNNTRFNVRNNVDMLLRQLSLTAKNKGIEVMYFVDPLISDEYIGDKVRFNQVLINLTNNAMKFTGSGYVHIRVDKIEKSKTSDKLEISVEDTGIGIPKSYRGDIFKMFTQADDTSTRKFGGTGLGLTIAKDLAQLMGGDIRFESEEGKGSTFYFTVSLDKVEPEKSKSNENKYLETNDAQDKKVLVAEDNKINKKIVSGYLRNLNYQYKIVENGQEVIDELRDNSYDLILMDIQMPVLNGIEATEFIRNNEKATNEHIPIVAMTAHAMIGDKEELISKGMDGYISKPFELKTLTELLDKHLK